MGEAGAAERFWLELRTLYLAAGRPTLRRLVHLGIEQRPAAEVSHSTINGWLNGRAVPTGRKNERYLAAMIAFLQARVAAEDGRRRLTPGEWDRLLRAAQADRAAGQRNGRPRRPDGLVPRGRDGLSPRGPDGLAPRAADGTAAWAPAGSAPAGPVAAPALPGSPLVGRQPELAVLGERVKALATGRGGVAFVEGEPGIGKSALVRVAVQDCTGLGGQVFWGTGSELDEALPLQPLFDALRVREPSANPRRDTIARFLRGETGIDRGLDGPAMLSEQLLALISEECATRPTVLVLDDLQWADRASLGLLARLAASAAQLPLLLVAVSRPVPQRDDLAALRRTAGQATRLRLAGLTRPAVAELVGVLAGGTPDGQLLTLADGAAGNPLYLTELIAALARTFQVTVTSGGTATLAAAVPRSLSAAGPRSLSAAIADRLGFLSAAAREALRSASLLGPEFTVTELAVLLGRSVASLSEPLQESCAAGVLSEAGRRFQFRHPLIHAALYQELPGPVRAAWHREAARALASAGAPADRVARQLLSAATGPDGPPDPADEWMLGWLAETAETLVAQAPPVAAELLGRAVAGLPAGSPRRGPLASQLADALYRVGERTAAAELAVRELAVQGPGELADPDVFIGLHWTLAQCRLITGAYTDSMTTLDRALAAPGLAPGHRGRLLVLTARTHSSFGKIETAGRVASAALAAAEEARDTWATAWALQTMAAAAAMGGRSADALAWFDRGLTVSSDDPALIDLRLLLQINKAAALGNLDRHQEALPIARQARELAGQVGTTLRLGQAHGVLGELLFETGRWDEARAEHGRLPANMKEDSAACAELGTAARISLHRGEVAAARDFLAAAAPYSARVGQRLLPPLVLARSLDYEYAGALPAALSELTHWLDGRTEEAGSVQDLIPDAVRLAVCTGDREAARVFAGRSIVPAAGGEMPSAQGNRLYCQGLVDGDAALLLAAAERYAHVGRPLPWARALEAAAVAHAAAGDAERGRQVLAGATAVYDGLGARATAARAQAAYQAAGLR